MLKKLMQLFFNLITVHYSILLGKFRQKYTLVLLGVFVLLKAQNMQRNISLNTENVLNWDWEHCVARLTKSSIEKIYLHWVVNSLKLGISATVLKFQIFLTKITSKKKFLMISYEYTFLLMVNLLIKDKKQQRSSTKFD